MAEAAIELARRTRPDRIEAAQVHVERVLLVELKRVVRLRLEVITHHLKACTGQTHPSPASATE
jgi:hypothetical protein